MAHSAARRTALCLALGLWLGAPLAVQAGTATFLEPSSYFSRCDSPFIDDLESGAGVLEDFEDGVVDAPGVTVSAGLVAQVPTDVSGEFRRARVTLGRFFRQRLHRDPVEIAAEFVAQGRGIRSALLRASPRLFEVEARPVDAWSWGIFLEYAPQDLVEGSLPDHFTLQEKLVDQKLVKENAEGVNVCAVSDLPGSHPESTSRLGTRKSPFDGSSFTTNESSPAPR